MAVLVPLMVLFSPGIQVLIIKINITNIIITIIKISNFNITK